MFKQDNCSTSSMETLDTSSLGFDFYSGTHRGSNGNEYLISYNSEAALESPTAATFQLELGTPPQISAHPWPKSLRPRGSGMAAASHPPSITLDSWNQPVLSEAWADYYCYSPSETVSSFFSYSPTQRAHPPHPHSLEQCEDSNNHSAWFTSLSTHMPPLDALMVSEYDPEPPSSPDYLEPLDMDSDYLLDSPEMPQRMEKSDPPSYVSPTLNPTLQKQADIQDLSPHFGPTFFDWQKSDNLGYQGQCPDVKNLITSPFNRGKRGSQGSIGSTKSKSSSRKQVVASLNNSNSGKSLNMGNDALTSMIVSSISSAGSRHIDSNNVPWLVFEYPEKKAKKKVHHIRCDIENLDPNLFEERFKTQNCVYPKAMVPPEMYSGHRQAYETKCNEIGWTLVYLNPQLAGYRGLIQRAVDTYRNTTDASTRSRRVRRIAKQQLESERISKRDISKHAKEVLL